VLDDYHVIETKAIHQGLAFLIDHLLASMHLVLLTRADPPLALARLRASNQLTEIRAEHLRFNAEETSQFLHQVMGLKLTREQVGALEGRSEGWIAGLQLAALSLQKQEDLDGFVSAFTGSHRYIVDYLAEEVLDRQPPAIRAFLLETSLLDRMNASLCDAVTGRADGQATLEKLEQNNLFLIPLDNERGWYRYHHLFTDLLQARLVNLMPGKVPELQCRAAAWFAQNSLMEEAIAFALKARDMEQAALWIEQYADTISSQGRVATLTTWIGALPEETITKRPRLGLSQAWALYLEYQIEQIEVRLQKIEQNLTPKDAQQLEGEIALWHGILARWHGDIGLSRTCLQRAMEQLPPEQHSLQGRARLFLGMVTLEKDANRGEELFIQARDIYESEKIIQGALAALYYLASTQNLQGSPVRAFTTGQRALRLAGQIQDWPVASYAHLALAEALYAQNELEQAGGYLKKGKQLAEMGGYTNNQYVAMLNGACLERANGHMEEAQRLLTRAEELARPAIPLMMAQVDSEQVLLYLAQGKSVEAAEWLRQSQVLNRTGELYPTALEQISQARVRIAQNEPGEALEQLPGLLEKVIPAGMLHLAIQIQCLQALAYQALDQPKDAMESLREALALAEPRKSLRVFLDQGTALLPLLQKARQNKVSPELTARLLAAFSPTRSHGESSPPQANQMQNTLSKRELELLGIIASGCSNKEIASQLFISLATVKRHTVNIFNKLGVKNRTEAVARARELGLL
jgi:LuxR family maltose regulon positive regulatory protein